MKHSLIVATKVLFVCIVFCYPFSLEAVTKTSESICSSISMAQDTVITPTDSLGAQSKTDIGTVFTVGAVAGAILSVILFFNIPNSYAAILVGLILISLLGSTIVLALGGIVLSRKKRNKILSAIALMAGLIMYGYLVSLLM